LFNGKTGAPKVHLKVPRLLNRTHNLMLLMYRPALWGNGVVRSACPREIGRGMYMNVFLASVSAIYACKHMRTHRACVNEIQLLRFEAVRAVLLQVQIFRDVSPCRQVNSDRRFEGSLCFRTQSIPRNVPESSNI